MSFPDLFDHFDHVYIVNLPYRDDRRRETIADFARVGVTIPNEHITFFEASRPTEKANSPRLALLATSSRKPACWRMPWRRALSAS